MSQLVAIFGPNLIDQSKGSFVVHAHDCRDANRMRASGEQESWKGGVDIETKDEAALEIYCDHIEEGSMDLDDAMGDVHFCPCVKVPTNGTI